MGLYMSPPEHALVLCCDEKSQVQALDRTQPGLPTKKGRAAAMTHDYKRQGPTRLFAALFLRALAVEARRVPAVQRSATHPRLPFRLEIGGNRA